MVLRLALLMLFAAPLQAQVNLTWTAPPASLGAIGGYVIFRSEQAHVYNSGPLHSGVLVLRSYKDATAVSGKTYWYTIVAVNGASQPIGNSKEITLTAPVVVVTTPPPVVVPPVPVSVCTTKPAALSSSNLRWPGAKTGSFKRMVLTDDRGCTVTITR